MHARHGTWDGSRREFLGGAAKLAAGGTLAAALARHGLGRAFAQGTPAAMAYPELKVTITDSKATGQAFQVSTTRVPAGYVLLTAVNQSRDQSSVGLIGPGPGQTMAQLQQEAATPTPANGFLPPFFYTAAIAGGPSSVPPGGTGQAVIQLAAGDWAIFGGSEASNPPPVFVTATAGTPTTQAPPPATVTITEVDFAFGGFGRPIPAGKQTWQVVNQGTQPHMLGVSQIPAGTTLAHMLEAVSRPGNATPPPGGLRREDFQDRGGVIVQSPGTTVWPLLDLPAGHYVALCFVGDPTHGGKPHAMEGMIAVFDVGSTETPVATPAS